MNYFYSLLFGFIITFMSTFLPGLINMNVAKISLKEGKQRAVIFSFGASFVVFFQAFVALAFARFIDKRIDINQLIQQIGIVIFLMLSIYFFFFAKTNKTPNKKMFIRNKRNFFLTGMLLSIVNLFPVPFYVVLGITLSSYNFFDFDKSLLVLFSFGSALGAMLVFYIYANFIKKLRKTDFFIKNINYLIGSVTFLVAILGIAKLIST